MHSLPANVGFISSANKWVVANSNSLNLHVRFMSNIFMLKNQIEVVLKVSIT